MKTDRPFDSRIFVRASEMGETREARETPRRRIVSLMRHVERHARERDPHRHNDGSG